MHNIEPSQLEGIQKVKNRVYQSLKNNGLLIDLSNEQCKKYLQRKVNSKTRVVVMYIDINGSTQMSRDLSSSKLSLMIQIFSQEVSLSIINFGGYVLKFVGDAVIALFPSDFNPKQSIENSFLCAKNILNIIQNGLNPIFKENKMLEISVKIGIEYGESIVIVYGKNAEFAPIDLIGFSISIASKITSLAAPNDILIGENAYDNISSNYKKNFINLSLDKGSKWDSIMKYNNNIKYRIFKYTEK